MLRNVAILAYVFEINLTHPTGASVKPDSAFTGRTTAALATVAAVALVLDLKNSRLLMVLPLTVVVGSGSILSHMDTTLIFNKMSEIPLSLDMGI